MRVFLAAVLLLAPALCRAALPAQFEGSSMNASGTMVLKAAQGYISLDQLSRAAVVIQAVSALNLPADKPLAVQWSGGGELWTMKDNLAVKLDGWSDKSLPFGPSTSKGGRWFGSFGVQSMGGGDYPASSMNLRVGSTLLKNKYDLAGTYDYYKPAKSITYRASMGLVGRMLMPLSPHGGWNAGVQLSMVNSYGERKGYGGLVTGLNIYLPRGSFDITLNLQDKGSYSLLVGCTVFVTR